MKNERPLTTVAVNDRCGNSVGKSLEVRKFSKSCIRVYGRKLFWVVDGNVVPAEEPQLVVMTDNFVHRQVGHAGIPGGNKFGIPISRTKLVS